MADQQKTSYLANALVGYAHKWIATLPSFYQNFIPMDKIPAGSGALAKFCLDTIEAYDATHAPPLIAHSGSFPDAENIPKRIKRRRK